MSVPLILFSGGMDSTLMLQQLLVTDDVETLYVCGAQGPDKIKKELVARKKIIDKLERITGHKVLQDHVVNLGSEIFCNVPDYSWSQPMLWLVGALQVSDGRRHSHLSIGYVSGDSILSHLHDITQAWYHTQMFSKSHVIPVYFPLRHREKWLILNDIDHRVWEDVWVCEIPKKIGRTLVPCEGCAGCHTRAAALLIWKRRNQGKTYASHIKKLMSKNGTLPRRLVKRLTLNATL